VDKVIANHTFCKAVGQGQLNCDRMAKNLFAIKLVRHGLPREAGPSQDEGFFGGFGPACDSEKPKPGRQATAFQRIM
jgi:hypothetical protein